MKKLFTLICIFFSLTACSENQTINIPSKIENSEFYTQNPEKAKQLIQQCESKEVEKIIDKQLSTLDEKGFANFIQANANNYIAYKANCLAAEYGLGEYKNNQYLQKKKEDEDNIKKQVSDAIKSEKEKFANLTWEQAIHNILSSENVLYSLHTYIITGHDTDYRKTYEDYERELEIEYTNKMNSPEDKKESYEKRIKYILSNYIYKHFAQTGFDTLKSLPEDTLIIEPEYCKIDKRKHSACAIWEMANKEKVKEKIIHYMDNFDKLKQDYNQYCVQQGQNGREILETTSCYAPAKALENLGFSLNLKEKLN